MPKAVGVKLRANNEVLKIILPVDEEIDFDKGDIIRVSLDGKKELVNIISVPLLHRCGILPMALIIQSQSLVTFFNWLSSLLIASNCLSSTLFLGINVLLREVATML